MNQIPPLLNCNSPPKPFTDSNKPQKPIVISFYKSHFGNACIYQTFSKHIYNVIWNIYFKIVSLLGSPQLLSYVTVRKKKWITLYPWNSGAVIRWLSWKLPQMTSRH